jgi:ketosteroid isomerase-like protein
MTKDRATELITIYGKAWTTRDADLILTIFTPDATYFDPREGVQEGHAGIKAYWETKVIGSQKDITFKLLNLWQDGDTVIAEWNATFIDVSRQLSIDMMEIAVFKVAGDRFSSLRKYYKTSKSAA